MLSSDTEHWFWRLIGLDDFDPLVFDERRLRFYQHFMAQEVEARDILLLAAEMGLGKTAAVLLAIRRMIDSGKIKGPVLIVAPLLVAQETWPNEIAKWEFSKSLTYSLIRAEDDDDDVVEACQVAARGERALLRVEGETDSEFVARRSASVGAQMRATIKEKIRRWKLGLIGNTREHGEFPDIHIINRELLPWLKQTWGRKWPYRMLVYDEASRLKKGSKRTAKGKVKKDGEIGVGRRISEFGALAQMRPIFEKVIELSGTPAPKGLHDLWGPSYILDHGARLGRSMTAFNDRWFDFGRWDYSITPKSHAFDEIMGALGDVMISLKKEDYLNLPPLTINPVMVDLPTPLMKAYKKFERTLYLEMHDIEAISSGVLTNKLLQFANGSVYDADGNDKLVHNLKLRKLESIVEEAAGAPIMVAYEFKFDLAAIRKRWPKAVLVGEKNWLKRWSAGEIAMLLLHPASAAHGLNLQFGGHIGVWFGLTWSLELYLQAIDRLHRQGQESDFVIWHLIMARGTADEAMFETLQTAGVTQDMITDAVRVRLQAAA